MVPILGGAMAALTAANAARTATTAALVATRFRGGSPVPDDADYASGEPQGQWRGVQCCPQCRRPITKKEVWDEACCSRCGHTEDVYIHTITRARRRAQREGSEEWVWEYLSEPREQDSATHYIGWFVYGCLGLVGLGLIALMMTA